MEVVSNMASQNSSLLKQIVFALAGALTLIVLVVALVYVSLALTHKGPGALACEALDRALSENLLTHPAVEKYENTQSCSAAFDPRVHVVITLRPNTSAEQAMAVKDRILELRSETIEKANLPQHSDVDMKITWSDKGTPFSFHIPSITLEQSLSSCSSSVMNAAYYAGRPDIRAISMDCSAATIEWGERVSFPELEQMALPQELFSAANTDQPRMTHSFTINGWDIAFQAALLEQLANYPFEEMLSAAMPQGSMNVDEDGKPSNVFIGIQPVGEGAEGHTQDNVIYTVEVFTLNGERPGLDAEAASRLVQFVKDHPGVHLNKVCGSVARQDGTPPWECLDDHS